MRPYDMSRGTRDAEDSVPYEKLALCRGGNLPPAILKFFVKLFFKKVCSQRDK